MAMSVHIRIVMMPLIRSYAQHVVMAAVHIDVLMFAVRYMSMRLGQGRQHEADTHKQAEHARQGGHRSECKRTTGRLAILAASTPYSDVFRSFWQAYRPELTFTLGEAVQCGP